MIPWEEVKVPSKLMLKYWLILKYWNGNHFPTNRKNKTKQNKKRHNNTHIKCIGFNITIDLCTLHCYSALTFWLSIVLCALLSMMIPWYNTMLPTRLHRIYVFVIWCLTVCQKNTPISSIQHQFWCHFYHISHVLHFVKYLQINSLYFPTSEKCDF